jgi:RND family efflux transporter MFP subunit
MSNKTMTQTSLAGLMLACTALGVAGCDRIGMQAAADVGATDAVPAVSTAQARPADDGYELSLPARAIAGESVRLHARATGFVVERLVDIGDRVKAGQVLARIAAPEIDQTVLEARAELGRVRTALELARANYERAASLVEIGAISQEVFNERVASRDGALAAATAAQARLANASERQGFQTVKAPFDGVVVARSIERGDRVVGDSAATAAPLFEVSALDPLRVLVDVPQSAALQVQAGMQAAVTFSELGGEVLEAQVVRSAHSIAQDIGAMRVELSLANPGERIPAGMVGTVRLKLPRAVAVMVPVAAVARLGSGEPRVAMVDESGIVRYQSVTLGRNHGNEIEVLSGLTAGSTVVLTPNALLTDGTQVRLRKAE